MAFHKDYIDPGKIIAVRRSELSMTQKELAKALGYKNPNFISMLERETPEGEESQTKVPIESIIKIADVLEIDKLWFIERVFRARGYTDLADFLFPAAIKMKRVS